MAATVALHASLPQLPDDLDRLFEHLEALVRGRPAVSQDVLVEGLARADTQRKPPSSRTADVAAACATIAGWSRTVGHVTAVVILICSVTCARAPTIDHTNGLWPCSSFHGWK